MCDLSILDGLYSNTPTAAPTEDQLTNEPKYTVISVERLKWAQNRYTEIVRGLKKQDDNYTLLLKAMEIIAIIAGKDRYYLEPQQIVTELHGRVLGKSKPLELIVQSNNQKLTMLRNSLKNPRLTDSGRAIIEDSIEELELDNAECNRRIAEGEDLF